MDKYNSCAPRLHVSKTEHQFKQGPHLQLCQHPRPPALPASCAHFLGLAVEMLEMVVADDLLASTDQGAGARARGPTKRLVPAPHKSTPAVASRPAPPPAAQPATASLAAAPAAPPPVNGVGGGTSSSGSSSGTALNGSSYGAGSGARSSGSSLVNGGARYGAAPLSPANGSAAPNGTAGAPPPAAVQQLVTLQNSNKLVSQELVAAQQQAQQQQVELKSGRTELA